MREIKFRAFLQESKIMTKECTYLISVDKEIYGDYDNGKFIIMQFTGLKDKNGVEIYENDIVKYDEIFPIGKVSWERLNMRGAHVPEPYCWSVDGNNIDEAKTIEIIGNIHENPELLK